MTAASWEISKLHHCLILMVFLSGCGGRGPATAPVKGTITFGGKPLTEADVMFVPRQSGQPATGRTDQEGRFTLTTFEDRQGAVLGVYDVTISKIDKPTYVPKTIFDAPPQPPKWLIPERYGNIKTSGFSAEVTSGENNFHFDLK